VSAAHDSAEGRSRGVGAAGFLAALLLGAICVPAAVAVSVLETRYVVALVAAAAGLVGLMLAGSFARARMILVVAMGIGLSVGLSISFLHQTELPGRYLPFVGGAQAVTVSLGQLGALGWLGLRMLESRLMRRPWRIALVPLVVGPQVLFMAVGVLSVVNALQPILSALELLRLAGLLMISVAVMNLSPRELRIFVWTLVLGILPQFLLVCVQFGTGRNLGLAVLGETALVQTTIDAGAVARPGGTFGDPNILSYFFEITYPIALAMALAGASAASRLGGVVSALASLGGVILSYSRGAWSTIPISTGIVVLLVLGRRVLSVRTAIIGILGSLVAAGAVVSAWPFISTRLFGDDAGSFGHRLPLARAALSMWEQFPLLGVGLNNFAVSFNLYDRTAYSRIFNQGDHVVHSLHLLVLSETGMIGYAAFLFQFVAAVILARRIRNSPLARALAIGACTGFLAHLIHGFVDPGFKLSLTVSQLIAGLFGLIAALWLHDRNQAPPGMRLGIASPPGRGAP
jgi:O-antigen ligase